VIAGVRAKQKAEAQKLGAEQVVALDDEGEISGLPDLDAVADIGGETIAKLLPKTRKGGSIGSVVGEPASAKGRDLRVKAMLTHPDSKRLRELAEAVARGELDIPVEKTFPLAQAGEAHRFAEKGGVGKVLLVP
jgi:NADPH:quinone reductase-like Zn-dependent oxidoreductase